MRPWVAFQLMSGGQFFAQVNESDLNEIGSESIRFFNCVLLQRIQQPADVQTPQGMAMKTGFAFAPVSHPFETNWEKGIMINTRIIFNWQLVDNNDFIATLTESVKDINTQTSERKKNIENKRSKIVQL